MSKLFELMALDIPSISTPSDTKRPLVVRSGGADSTLMCYLLLKAGIAFDYFYVEGDHGHKKGFVEKLAILKQDQYFKNHPNTVVHKTFENCRELSCVSIVTQIHQNNENIRSSQAVTWLIAAMRHLDPKQHNAVYYAYLSSDQASIYIGDMRKAWEGMMAMTMLGCKHIPIEFPMLLMDKKDVIYSYLNETIVSLYQLTWSCQLPKPVENGYEACIGSDEAVNYHTCSTCATRRMIEDANINRKPPIWKGDIFVLGGNEVLITDPNEKDGIELTNLDDIKEIES